LSPTRWDSGTGSLFHHWQCEGTETTFALLTFRSWAIDGNATVRGAPSLRSFEITVKTTTKEHLMDSEQLIQSLGLTLGLPNLRFDTNGCARIAIDGAPALNLERNDDGAIHLYSVLGPVPPEGREGLYAQMLHGNLFGASTAGATLAVDPMQNEVMLCRAITCELMSAAAFTLQVEAFVAAAEDWQGRLDGAPAVEPDADASSPSPAPRMMDRLLRG
jgi:hypothetical protein